MKRSKLRVTGLCAGNSPGTGKFPAQMASNVENVSIWWRHHDTCDLLDDYCEYLEDILPCYTRAVLCCALDILWKFLLSIHKKRHKNRW